MLSGSGNCAISGAFNHDCSLDLVCVSFLLSLSLSVSALFFVLNWITRVLRLLCRLDVVIALRLVCSISSIHI